MRATALHLLAVVFLLGGVAGCEKEAGGSSAGAAGTTQPDRATSAGATKASPPADTRAVCAPVDGEIKNTLAKVAEAEAIGPPAGHHAVSAQWSAGRRRSTR